MANTKEYKIVINGITESIEAVKALDKELFNLEERIKSLEAKSVNIKATSSGGGGSSRTSNVSSLTEEAKLERQIEQLDAKREAYSKEIYQNYLAAKDVLNETVKDQKQLAAAERLSAGNYSNTMQGMKQELADIKQVMQTVDLADTSKFDELTKRANELNSALLEIEKSYGQFGRNVGNYKSAVDGITVVIGNATAQFDNAKQALKELKKERDTLSTKKDLGLISEEEAQRLKDLIPVVAQLKSSIEDAGKPMDALMDSMQSFVAVTQTTKGLGTFFGFDNTEIEKSIQKLVALQNAMQGLKTIQDQMNSEEGIGKIFAKGFKQIDKFTESLKATTTQSKLATVGIKGLNLALKALASLGVFAVMTLIAEGVYKIVDALKDWVKGNADLVSSEQLLQQKIDITNDALSRKLELINAQYDAQELTYAQKMAETEKAYADAIKDSNDELEKRLKLNDKNSTFANAYNNSGAESWNKFLQEDKGVTTLGGWTEAAGTMDELRKRYEALSKAVENNTRLTYKNAKGFEICHLSAEDCKDELNHMEQFMSGQLTGSFKQFDIETEKGRKQLQEFVNGIMNSDDDLRKSILLRLPEIVDNEKGNLGDALNNWLTLIKQFANLSDAAMNKVDFEKYANSLIDAADETGKRLKQRQLQELTDRYNALSKKEQEAEKDRFEQAKAAIEKNHQKRLNKVSAQGQKLADKEKQIEADIAKARIDGMKESLNKTITQLEEDRKARLNKLTNNMKNYKELEKQINDVYNERILKATEEWKEQMEKTHDELWANIVQKEKENLESSVGQITTTLEKNLQQQERIYSNFYKAINGYSIFGKLGKGAKAFLGTMGIQSAAEDNLTKEVKMYVDQNREIFRMNQEYVVRLKEFQKEKDALSEEDAKREQENLDRLKKELADKKQENVEYYSDLITLVSGDTEIIDEIEKRLYQEGYTSDISKIFAQRIELNKRYWLDIKEVTESGANAEYSARFAVIKKEEEQENASNDNWRRDTLKKEKEFYEDRISGVKTQYDKRLITKGVYDKKIEEAEKDHTDALESIQAEWKTKSENIAKEAEISIEKIQKEKNEKIKKNDIEEFESRLQEFRDFQTAISDIEQRQPVRTAWGFIDWKETDKNNMELKNSYISLLEEITHVRDKAYDILSDTSLSAEFKQQVDAILRESNRMTSDVSQDLEVLAENMSNWTKTQTFFQDIQMYFQEVASSFMDIMNTIWKAQDTQNDKEAEALDKQNKIIQDKLDKQKDIIEKHKDKIDSIEDELSTARGDRRQRLIDQLNAEMRAQRQAAAEEKKLEKEKKALEDKQDDLEKKRKKQQYHRDMLQAVVNGAMAVTYAAANKWPIPAIPMMALAAATTAAQIGIMAANKPYAKGGLLEGPSHAEGGIPVGRTGIEVEGKEYVIRKKSTAPNIEILDYINKSERKLDLDDFIEFYSSGKLKKNITQMSPSRKFAEGGTIPTLNNDYSFNDRLLDAFEDYSNRPVVVSVKEILNTSNKITKVETLAGLTPSSI